MKRVPYNIYIYIYLVTTNYILVACLCKSFSELPLSEWLAAINPLITSDGHISSARASTICCQNRAERYSRGLCVFPWLALQLLYILWLLNIPFTLLLWMYRTFFTGSCAFQTFLSPTSKQVKSLVASDEFCLGFNIDRETTTACISIEF